MANEKKTLINNFQAVIKDLLDNYDKYTEEEKKQIKELFQKASDLNAILDKYDIQTQCNWQEYYIALSCYFGAN